jgi:hypothetical protein
MKRQISPLVYNNGQSLKNFRIKSLPRSLSYASAGSSPDMASATLGRGWDPSEGTRSKADKPRGVDLGLPGDVHKQKKTAHGFPCAAHCRCVLWGNLRNSHHGRALLLPEQRQRGIECLVRLSKNGSSRLEQDLRARKHGRLRRHVDVIALVAFVDVAPPTDTPLRFKFEMETPPLGNRRNEL